MSIEKVIVFGASADQGIPLVNALQRRGFSLTAGARRADAMAGTPFPDLRVVHADITDSDTLKAAFAGQDALVMHLPFEFNRERAASFGRAIAVGAKGSGLRKIVFNTSCFVADHDLDLTAHDGRRDIERALEGTGIPCVFIEPTVFMDNIVRAWTKPSIVNNSIFAYPAAPDLKISWIALSDVSEYMAASLETDRADGRHIPVGGPEALTGDEVAQRLSAEIGKPVVFRSLDPGDFAASMSELVTGSRTLTPGTPYEGMAKFYRFYNTQPQSPLLVDPGKTAELIDVTPTRMSEWLKRWDWTKPI
ncbi:SDR family oxidoreductase [Novosphingobium sp.]|uniref:SDR family oxidoreductase n=1 Tax=Novosphingobium sp. TaxID=1874826 RepID=UPI0025D89A34|nr:NmrA family NAD(P)-binding protein [Novosphingobium sp.]